MTAKKKEEAIAGFILPTEEVTVDFIKRQTGYIENPKHVAYGGKLDGATDTVPVKMLRSGQLMNVLTKAEKTYLEGVLGFDLSIYTNKEFWESQYVVLSKESIRLNLADPYDYIKFKILEGYTDLVAPSLKHKDDKLTYRYVIVRDGDNNRLAKGRVDIRKEAYKELGKIETSPTRMLGVLRLAGKRTLSSHTKVEDLEMLVGQLAESNPSKFLELVKDAGLDIKIKIDQGIEAGVIEKDGIVYRLKDGSALCHSGLTATLSNAVDYLGDPKNQDILLMIESKIK